MHEAASKTGDLIVAIVCRLAGDPKARPGAVFQAEMGRQAGVGRTGMGVQRPTGLNGREADMKAIVRDSAQDRRRARASREIFRNRLAVEKEIESGPGLGVVMRVVTRLRKRRLHGRELSPDLWAGLADALDPRVMSRVVDWRAGQAGPTRQPGNLQLRNGRWSASSKRLGQQPW